MIQSTRLMLAMGALALAGVMVTLTLGGWQTGRAQEKAERQAHIEAALSSAPYPLDATTPSPESLVYRRVRVRGSFMPQHTILLDNRLRKGRAGYEVITPLVLAPGRAVLINRGWLSANGDRSLIPAIATPEGEQSIEAVALAVRHDYLELSDHTVSGALWQNLDFPRFARERGLDLLPLILQQRSELPDGLNRDWPPPDARIDTHRAYAMQWYTMSAAIALAFLVFYVRRKRA